MEFFKETHIGFMRLRWINLCLSIVVVCVGGISYFMKGGLSYGVDFAGGTVVQFKFSVPQDIGSLRSRLHKIGLSGSRIQQLGGQNEYLLRIEQSTKEREQYAGKSAEELDVIKAKVVQGFQDEGERKLITEGKIDLNNIGVDRLTTFIEPMVSSTGGATPATHAIAKSVLEKKASLGGLFHNFDELKLVAGIPDAVYSGLKDKAFLGTMSVIRTEIVGPQVGAELRHKAVLATIWALIGMLVYIWFRFELVYGISTILTLTHDVLVVVGMISLFNYDFDLTMLAAVLTIVGYSVNDTVVIFDRIRDNVKLMKKEGWAEICDRSINQTLSRTILTTGTVFVTVLSLFFFGGDVIHPFAFTMLVGVISGTYSTIYMSCPILLWWKQIAELRKVRAIAKRKAGK